MAWRQLWLTDVSLALVLRLGFFCCCFFLTGVGAKSAPVSQLCEVLATESAVSKNINNLRRHSTVQHTPAQTH